jgi:hypothetical protein
METSKKRRTDSLNVPGKDILLALTSQAILNNGKEK